MTNKTEFGQWAEVNVVRYLKSKEYEILGRNYQKKWGEIDIIAQKGGVLIFVEVKANKKDLVGFEPENRVSQEKLRRMNRAIQTYLAHKRYPPEQDWQIDVISLIPDLNRGVAKIRHFKNIDT